MKANITIRFPTYLYGRILFIGNICINIYGKRYVNLYDHAIDFNTYRTMIREVRLCENQIKQSIERMKK